MHQTLCPGAAHQPLCPGAAHQPGASRQTLQPGAAHLLLQPRPSADTSLCFAQDYQKAPFVFGRYWTIRTSQRRAIRPIWPHSLGSYTLTRREQGPSSPLRSLFAAKLVGRWGDGPRFAGGPTRIFEFCKIRVLGRVFELPLPHKDNWRKNRWNLYV